MVVKKKAFFSDLGKPQEPAEVMEGILSRWFAELPDTEEGLELGTKLREQFEKLSANPPIDELEAVLRERFTVERARELMFDPSEQEFAFYSDLIANPPDGAPAEHPQFKIQKIFLNLLQLSHIHQASLARVFILADGLVSLAGLVVHPNLRIRAQALESFMVVTSSEDWFTQPPTPQQMPLHRNLLKLTRCTFINDLLANCEHSFPGGSFVALQLMGFFLSWLRLFYCKDNTIYVSDELIDILRIWSRKKNLSAEESELAQKLFDDFKRFPSEDADSIVTIPNTNDTVSIKPDRQRPKFPINSFKSLGNTAFANGSYSDAIDLYCKALKETDSDSMLSRVHANLAAAYILEAKSKQVVALYSHALENAALAIQLDPSYTKVYFRKVQALIALERFDEADLSISIGMSTSVDSNEQSVFRSLRQSISLQVESDPVRKLELFEIYSAVMTRLGASVPELPSIEKQKTIPISCDKHIPRKKAVSKLNAFKQLSSSSDVVEMLLPLNQDEFSSLFGNNLDEQMLVTVIDAVDSLLPQEAVSALFILERMSNVRRISLVMMFLGKVPKDKLVSCLAIVKSMKSDQQLLISEISKKFEL